MKKLIPFLLIPFGFIIASCGNKEKVESIAAKMVEAQIKGYSYEIHEVENELKECINNLSSDESSEMETVYEDALIDNFKKAFDKELSEIADNIRSHSYYSIKYSFERYSTKIEKVDEKYRKFAYASLSSYMSQSFAKELEGYADAVFKAIKEDDKYEVGRADKDFCKTCDKVSEECSEISNALKTAYRDVLRKKFENYVKENLNEYEKLCIKGDKDGAEEWLKNYNKQVDKILSKASSEVKSSFVDVIRNITQEMMKTNKE